VIHGSSNQHLGRSFDFGAADDTLVVLAASLCIAKRKRVVVDELTIQVAVRIDDDDSFAIRTCQFADHWLLSILPVSGESLHTPETTSLLPRNFNRKVLFEQPRLVERPLIRRPMAAATGHNG
jgi:hypothetical protein